jgi:hypothetical protein
MRAFIAIVVYRNFLRLRIKIFGARGIEVFNGDLRIFLFRCALHIFLVTNVL